MKSLLNKILVFVFGTCISFSCADLDLVDPDNPSEGSFWQTESDLLQGVMAAYDQLQSGFYDDGIRTFSFVISDEATQEWPFELRQVCTFETAPSLEFVAPVWASSYGLISRAYQVIENSGGISGDGVNQIVAEAKFLVALAYYNLIGYYGENVAYVAGVQNPADFPVRAEDGQLWMLAETLLTEAISDLPLASAIPTNEYGRISQGAAQVLLAKIHLMQQEYAEALPLLQSVVESGQYSLNPNFEDNFTELGVVNPESVFQVNFLHNGLTTENDDSRFFRYNSPVEFKELFGDIQVTNFVRDEFLSETTSSGDRDPRMDATIFWTGSTRLFYGLTHAAWMASGTSANEDITNSLYKYSEQVEVSANGNGEIALDEDGGTDFIVFRYADVLLLYAEVLNQQGSTGEAYGFVNQVRQRAGMPDLVTGLSQDAFFAQIQHERVVELTGENVRHFDLIRWGEFNKANEVRDENFSTFVDGVDNVWPIPQSELDLNPNLLQNPGH